MLKFKISFLEFIGSNKHFKGIEIKKQIWKAGVVNNFKIQMA